MNTSPTVQPPPLGAVHQFPTERKSTTMYKDTLDNLKPVALDRMAQEATETPEYATVYTQVDHCWVYMPVREYLQYKWDYVRSWIDRYPVLYTAALKAADERLDSFGAEYTEADVQEFAVYMLGTFITLINETTTVVLARHAEQDDTYIKYLSRSIYECFEVQQDGYAVNTDNDGYQGVSYKTYVQLGYHANPDEYC